MQLMGGRVWGGTSCFDGTPVNAKHLGGWAEETSFPHGVPMPMCELV